jgi:beta-ureidopropionase / N-carbamoyl-L-amino-acid hydrolase
MKDENNQSPKVPRIDKERLWRDLMEVGKIGFQEGLGVTRPAFSDADMEARNWLMERMDAAGLEIRTDAAANVIGTLRGATAASPKILAVGSHLDAVPGGGRFDGALGVVAALECARVLKENGIELPWHLEVIDFSDEEAAYNTGTVGSRAMIGKLTDGEIFRSRKKGRSTFAEKLRGLNKDPDRISEAVREPNIFRAVLELHIEQGTRLETENLQVGAVTGIVGIYRYIVTVRGTPGHAGTTPMHLRDDALIKAAPAFTLLPHWVREQNPDMVGTIGQVSLEPGAINVIPGECEFVVELRSMEIHDMEAVRDRFSAWVQETPGASIRTILEKGGVPLAEPLIDTIVRVSEAEGLRCIRMPSGAGHDTQSFAPEVPCGMIFVPCRNGRSHCPEEWIEPEQAAAGCQAMLGTIVELAKKA